VKGHDFQPALSEVEGRRKGSKKESGFTGCGKSPNEK
jgi:hypothetical protein